MAPQPSQTSGVDGMANIERDLDAIRHYVAKLTDCWRNNRAERGIGEAQADYKAAMGRLSASHRGAVEALEIAYDAMVHRPVDSELFVRAIAAVARALGDPDDEEGR